MVFCDAHCRCAPQSPPCIRNQHVGRLLNAVQTLEAQHGNCKANAIASTHGTSGLTIANAKQALAVAY